MEYNVSILRKKIQEYYVGDLTRHDLGLWSETTYYDLLRGEYVYLEKLLVYPFLKKLALFHKSVDDLKDCFPLEEGEVNEIYRTLCGENPQKFFIQLAITNDIFNPLPEEYLYLTHVHDFILSGKGIPFPHECSDDQIEAIRKLIAGRPTRMVYDLIERRIASLFDALYVVKGRSVVQKPSLNLYLKKDSKNILFAKLDDILTRFLSGKDFGFVLNYYKLDPEIVLI